MAWSLLNPIAQLLVFNFVFSRVLPLNISNYTSFLFTGLLAWNWFQLSLYSAIGAIVDNRELIRRPGFPATVLPVVTVMSHFIHYLLALPVLLLFLVLSGVHLSLVVLLLPMVWVAQFALTLSLAYLVAALHVTFRDTQYLIGISLMLGFYLTPVFYDASSLPVRYRWIFELNPVAVLLDSYRAILLSGNPPEGLRLLFLCLAATILLAFGLLLFRKISTYFGEEL
jgi:lipopolysaccharide transport system permease protein